MHTKSHFLISIFLLSVSLLHGTKSLDETHQLKLIISADSKGHMYDAFYASPLFSLKEGLEITDGAWSALQCGSTWWVSGSHWDMNQWESFFNAKIPQSHEQAFQMLMASSFMGFKVDFEKGQLYTVENFLLKRQLGGQFKNATARWFHTLGGKVAAIALSKEWSMPNSPANQCRLHPGAFTRGEKGQAYAFFAKPAGKKQQVKLIQQLLTKDAISLPIGEESMELKTWNVEGIPLVVAPMDQQGAALIALNKEEQKSNKGGLLLGVLGAQSVDKLQKIPELDALIVPVSSSLSLPSKDEMDLSRNYQTGNRPLAPLIRVSPADVTEVDLLVDAEGHLLKVAIYRHAIVEAEIPAAGEDPSFDFKKSISLSASLEETLGGLILKKTRSDIVILENPQRTELKNALVFQDWLRLKAQNMGVASQIEIPGRVLKGMLKQIKQNQFSTPLMVLGADLKTHIIRKRPLVDQETYQVVLTEQALLALAPYLESERVSFGKAFSASMVQHTLFDADKEPLKVIEALHSQQMRAEKPLIDQGAMWEGSFPLSELLEEELAAPVLVTDWTEVAKSPARPILMLEINDLDVAYVGNFSNDSLLQYQKGAERGAKYAIGNARLRDPTFGHFLIYGNLGLLYALPSFETKLSTKIKYYQSNTLDLGAGDLKKELFDKRPPKDSVSVAWEMRIPLERLGGGETLGMVFSPVSRLALETQLFPNPLFTPVSQQYWPERVKDLSWFLGASAAPLFGRELFRVGGVLGYNLGKSTLEQALGGGVEAMVNYGTALGPFGLKIESYARYLFPLSTQLPDLDRLALVFGTTLKLDLAVIGNLSVAAMADVVLANTMVKPNDFLTGYLFGFAFSYGDRFKWNL